MEDDQKLKITQNMKGQIFNNTHQLFVAFSPAQANCLSLGEINSSQLVHYWVGFSVFFSETVGIAPILNKATELVLPVELALG